jgi:hypothetical protein
MAQFDFSEQMPYLAPVEPFRCKGLSAKFLDRLGRVRPDMSLVGQPAEESTNADKATIDRGNRLSLLPSQVASEIAHVPCRHPTDHERLSIRIRKPPSKLGQVSGDCPATLRRKVMRRQEPLNEGRLVSSDWNILEHLTTPVLYALDQGF